MTVVYIFALLMLIFGVYAVMSKSILRSAIGLMLCSASLAMVFNSMGAKLVSMFELSVCSGLVTVIFIAGISLSHSSKMELTREYNDKKRNKGLPALLIISGGALLALTFILGEGPMLALLDDSSVKELLWGARQADIWGQMAAILCGSVAITVLFREEKRNK